jgi:hypothetical protein
MLLSLLLIQGGGRLWPRHFAHQQDRDLITIMRLTPDEQSWLDAYCQLLKEQYQILKQLLAQYGPALCDQPGCYRSLLLDTLQVACEDEINTLFLTLQYGMV